MLMVGRVSEKAVMELQLGQLATGELADGRLVTGPVTFIGQQSDPQTRTYAVEIQLDNSDRSLRSGITAEIKIPVASVLAQRVSPRHYLRWMTVARSAFAYSTTTTLCISTM